MKRKRIKGQGEQLKGPNKKRKIALIISMILVLLGSIIFCYIYLGSEKKIKQPKKNIIKKEEKNLKIVDLKNNTRPIAVMIDNNTGRNNNNAHAGLDKAYITYEIIVEGGLTRIMALFKDKEVDLIGPVRSSRHYFLDYALESDAIYAHFGYSPKAGSDMKSFGVNNLDGMHVSKPYWRDNKLAAPHNVFTTTEKLYQSSEEKEYRKESSSWLLLNYSFEEINLQNTKKEEDEVLPASSISIRYSNAQTRSYQYNEDQKAYFRFMNNAPHNDKVTGEQLSYKNIIIMQVENSSLDNEGRQDLKTTGTGEGYYITNGYAIPINWEKSSRDSKTLYQDKNGKKIKINDGNTFIQIIPTIYNPEIS